MKCGFCDKQIPENGPYKEAIAVGTGEEATLCDGPSLGEAISRGIIQKGYSIPFILSPEKVAEISDLGLCAVVYQSQQAFQGKMVVVNKRTP